MTKMLTIAIALLVAGGTIQNAAAQKFSHRQAGNKFTQQQNNEAAESKFTAARDLIDDAQWIKAETQFAQYVAAYPQEKNADAAMYWMAYAQYKLRKFDQSKQTIDKLLKAYEKTAWKEDAETLLAQLPGAAVKIDPVNVEPTIAPGTPVAPVAPVAIAVPGAVIYTPAPGAPVALGQDPIEPQVRAEMQQRIAEAQARAQERTREAQDRVREKIAEAQAKWKDKNFVDFDYDFDFDFDFDYDSGNWGVGKGIGKGKGSAGDDDPCELKVVVLQALIENDPQRGISVATDWVKTGSTQTPTCRRAAVRLLARHGGKASIPTILGVAQNDPDPKVRLTAISSLGATNDDSVINPLRDFALNATDNQVAEAAVYALSQNTSAQAANVLADIALSNKPVNLRRAAINSISGRPGEAAVDALFKIYDSSNDLEIRKSVISGLSRRKSERAWARLLEIARSADNIELRKTAIGAIGRRGGDAAVTALINLYDSEKNEELKDQIMNALGYSNDARVTDKLISIAKSPQTSIDRKRRAIMLLTSRSKDPKVLQFLEDLLKQ